MITIEEALRNNELAGTDEGAIEFLVEELREHFDEHIRKLSRNYNWRDLSKVAKASRGLLSFGGFCVALSNFSRPAVTEPGINIRDVRARWIKEHDKISPFHDNKEANDAFWEMVLGRVFEGTEWKYRLDDGYVFVFYPFPAHEVVLSE